MDAIFDDDLAGDVRDDYRGLLSRGETPANAQERVLAEYSEFLFKPSGAPTVWVALAAAQLEAGELDPEVREQALLLIDSPSLLTSRTRRLSPDDVERRRAALAELRAALG